MTKRAKEDELTAERRTPEAVPAPAGPPPELARVLAAQRGAGNAMVSRALIKQRTGVRQIHGDWIGDIVNKAKKSAGMPYVATIGSEKVQVVSAAEEAEAARIIKDIQDKYGIEVSTSKGVQAVKDHYDKAPEDVRKKVKGATWLFAELVALERALAHFAPILGSRRSTSERIGAEQEITSASKVDQSITKNTATGALDDATLGEFFRDSKNFALFTPGETSDIDFPGDVPKQLEATTVHEIAHGLMKYAEGDFMKETGYWTDRATKSGTAGAEAPPTSYGDKNASEDLSESTMFFFVSPDRLKNGDGSAAAGTPGNPCPKRYAFLEKIVGKWKLPVGDFPTPNKDTAYA
ncbi:hypothetical protein DVA67_031805 [Solirubrobacter sp. CPCC 204708]|uniref:Lysine-specific metallo-endopeptidase domain-containing protein n=1 Tax=Solirubrobacter deserti TaxID=2282478 RepID=A0ABT4RQD5_9ACTN|nr:hypothetical protein [Solirubrobacter deserti]MBE2320588.1 hypothetical protein [Solirubrobacter deserti]MDA0140783.1 hypothetical protein [Solirubrobacter deserti]